jgi:Calcineurin-like phosphoesterase
MSKRARSAKKSAITTTAASTLTSRPRHSPSPLRALVINDLQIPLHDPRAVDVMKQIGHAYHPDVIVFNGDIYDLMNLSRYPSIKTELTAKVATDLESEIDRGFEIARGIVKEVRPSRAVWHNGNHEWRLMRMLSNAPKDVKQILELRVMRDVYSYLRLFRLDELGVPVHYVGEYPQGSWLHSSLPPERNVYIEHGYTARKKSGYTCTALMEDRMSSVICGHCEKLAGPMYRQVNGDRTFFGIENGNLSLIAIPGLGEGLYQGVPHSVPGYLNHTQGFSLVTYAEGSWWPETIRINKGKAWWSGKIWTSRV